MSWVFVANTHVIGCNVSSGSTTDEGVEETVRFTTYTKLYQAIHDNETLTDGCGDIIEKICNDRAGASASDDIGADDDDYLAVMVFLPVFKADDVSD